MFWVVNVSNSSLSLLGAASSLDLAESSSKIAFLLWLNIIVMLLTRSVMWIISIGRLSLRIPNISGVLEADGLGKYSGEDSEENVDNDDSVDDSEENVDNDDSVDDSKENADNDDSVDDSEENIDDDSVDDSKENVDIDDLVDDSKENVDNDDSVDVFEDSNECSDLLSRDDNEGLDVKVFWSSCTLEISISWLVWEVWSSSWFSDNTGEEVCVDKSDNKGLETKYCVFSKLLL